MSESKKRRSFTREYKLAVLVRMAETASIFDLAQELGLERKLLYCWREKYATGGWENLRRAGRPASATSAVRGTTPDEPRAWQEGVYAVIQAPIDPFSWHRQLRRRQRYGAFLGLQPHEFAALQPSRRQR